MAYIEAQLADGRSISISGDKVCTSEGRRVRLLGDVVFEVGADGLVPPDSITLTTDTGGRIQVAKAAICCVEDYSGADGARCVVIFSDGSGVQVRETRQQVVRLANR